MTTNPMQAQSTPASLLLCGAHCRTTGQPCKNHPMPNGRCRMHGGKSTGRPVTTGEHTQVARAEQSALTKLLRSTRQLLCDMKALQKS